MTSGQASGVSSAPDPVVATDPGETSPIRRKRDDELARDGWRRRFTGGPPRLEEMIELYRTLGREVLLDRVRAGELETECRGCGLALSFFRVVYTRNSEEPRNGEQGMTTPRSDEKGQG